MSNLPYSSPPRYHAMFSSIAELAVHTDRTGEWPVRQFEALNRAGILAWGIPENFQGESTPATEIARFYLDCSASCLTTAFVLSQRNAAVSRLVAARNNPLAESLLPRLARGEIFATVGISHLSTSRQHLQRPSVTLLETDSGYRLDGVVPWVTGVHHADLLVTGGTLPDGRQLLLALDATTPGLERGSAAEMLALNASDTGHLQLRNVYVPHEAALTEPSNSVMKSGGGGTGSLTTSTIALGVAGRAVHALEHEACSRIELQSESNKLREEWVAMVEELLIAEEQSPTMEILTTQTLRARANSLVLRAAQAYLTATKGAGFIAGHLAERTLREAMFFLVWSCPQPVAQAALRQFACTPSWT